MKLAECDCCGASAALEDVGTVCRACGGRGLICAYDDSWIRTDAEIEDYISQLNEGWQGDLFDD